MAFYWNDSACFVGSGGLCCGRVRAGAICSRQSPVRRRIGAVRWLASADEGEEGDSWKLPKESLNEAEEGNMVNGEEERGKLWAEIEALERYLKRVVAAERYKEAAEIKNELVSLKRRDPYVSLQMQLESAVEEERYLDAAKLRDEMKTMSPPPTTKKEDPAKQAPSTYPPPNASSKCEGVSNGIRIAIESFYMEEVSKPKQNIFVFGYKVKITNESSRTVQLIRREWKIRAVGGGTTEVKGAGVVGRQPVLEPRESFTYTSMCPLKTTEAKSGMVLGSMFGKYEFATGDTGAETFKADIREFYHVLP